MAQQDDESMQLDTVVEDLNLTSQATTIDAAVIQSRILQSASIQKEDASEQPHFAELSAVQAASGKVEYRRVRCPAHRYTPLREHWEQILTPLVEYLKLQVSTAIAEQQQSTCGPRRRRRFDTRVCNGKGRKTSQCSEETVLFLDTTHFCQEASVLHEDVGRVLSRSLMPVLFFLSV